MANIKQQLQTALNFEKKAKMQAKLEIQAHKRAVLRLERAQKQALALVSKARRARTRKQKYPSPGGLGKPDYSFGAYGAMATQPLLPAGSPLAERVRAGKLIKIAKAQEAVSKEPKLYPRMTAEARKRARWDLADASTANWRAAGEILAKVGGAISRHEKGAPQVKSPKGRKAPPTAAQLEARARFVALARAKAAAHVSPSVSSSPKAPKGPRKPPSAAQLAARERFVAMVRAKAAARK